MKIDWGALLLVSIVTLFATVVVVSVVSSAALLLDHARVRAHAGRSGVGAFRVGGYTLLGLCGVILLFGLWLIIPYLH